MSKTFDLIEIGDYQVSKRKCSKENELHNVLNWGKYECIILSYRYNYGLGIYQIPRKPIQLVPLGQEDNIWYELTNISPSEYRFIKDEIQVLTLAQKWIEENCIKDESLREYRMPLYEENLSLNEINYRPMNKKSCKNCFFVSVSHETIYFCEKCRVNVDKNYVCDCHA